MPLFIHDTEKPSDIKNHVHQVVKSQVTLTLSLFFRGEKNTDERKTLTFYQLIWPRLSPRWNRNSLNQVIFLMKKIEYSLELRFFCLGKLCGESCGKFCNQLFKTKWEYKRHEYDCNTPEQCITGICTNTILMIWIAILPTIKKVVGSNLFTITTIRFIT